MYCRFIVAFLLLLFVVSGGGCAGNRQPVDRRSGIDDPDLFDTSVRNVPPAPVLTMPADCFENDEIKIKVEANDIDSNHFTYMYDWDGNGVYDDVVSDSEMSHRWKKNGTYNVKVRVQDEQGGATDVRATLVVKDLIPEAKFTVSGNKLEGEWLKFDASDSNTVVDPIVKYEWDWNYDGKVFRAATTQGQQVENRWLANGSYTVALRITDSDGSQNIMLQSLLIEDQSPIARIVGPDELLVGQTGQYSASDSRSAVDKITGFSWDSDYNGTFKAGRATGANPMAQVTTQISWPKPGIYRLAVQVRDADGSASVTSKEIRVKLPKPVAPAKGK